MPRIPETQPPDLDGYKRNETNGPFAYIKIRSRELADLAFGLCRYYDLGADIFVHVDVSVTCNPWQWHDEPLRVTVNLTDENTVHTSLGSLSPASLIRLAEIKAMVDKWLVGEISELPPSTAPQFPVDLERRRRLKWPT